MFHFARRLLLFTLLSLLLVACGEEPPTVDVLAVGAAPPGAVARLGQGSLTQLAAAAEGPGLFAAGQTGVARYDAPDLAPVWAAATTRPAAAIAAAADGRWALAGLGNGDLLLLDGADGSELARLAGYDPQVGVTAVALQPDQDGGDPLFVAAFADGQLLAGRAAADGLEPLGLMQPQRSAVTTMAFNPDGRILASGNGSGVIFLYDAASLAQLTSLSPADSRRPVSALAWNPAGDQLAVGSSDGGLLVYDMLRLAPQVQLPRQTSGLVSLAFDAAGETLRGATAGGRLLAWDATGGENTPQVRDLDGDVTAAVGLADGGLLAGRVDGRLQLHEAAGAGWAVAAAVERADHAPRGTEVSAVALSPDGARVLVARGREAAIWPLGGGDPLILPDHAASTTAAAWSPDGALAATADRGGTIILWDAAAGEAVIRLDGGAQAVTDLAFSPDGALLAAATSLTDELRLWQVADGAAAGVFRGEGEGLWSVAWTADGANLLAGSTDGKLLRYTAADGSGGPRDSAWRHLAWISDIAVTADDLRVASSSADNGVLLWTLPQGDSEPLQGHQAPVRGVDFSPDGGRAVSGALDRQVIVWDTTPGVTNAIVSRFFGHTDGVTAVDWSADGAVIVSGSEDGTVVVWPAPE